jgi:hypothetical protein
MELDLGPGPGPHQDIGQGSASRDAATPIMPVEAERDGNLNSANIDATMAATTPNLRARKMFPLLPTRKRTNPFTFTSPPSSPSTTRASKRVNSPLTQSEQANEKIRKARQLLVEAAAMLSTNEAEQTQVLDLIEVFRDFVEKKTIPTTAKILATQVANLEVTSRKIATQAQKPLFSEMLQRRQPNSQSSSNGATGSTNSNS